MDFEKWWSILGWSLAAAFALVAIVGWGGNEVVAATCPVRECVCEPARVCDESLFNDCLRIFRNVNELADCANNQYCGGIDGR